MRPIALNIRMYASPFLCKWLAAEKFGCEKKKEKHFELKPSNSYYRHNKHLYTYRGHGRHNTEIRETRKNILSKPTSLPFGLKYGANTCVCMSIQKKREKKIMDLKPHFCLPQL